MTKTVSVRMDESSYIFVNKIAKQEKEDLSKAIRNIIKQGRIMLAIQYYQARKISLGKAAELSGTTISELIEIFTQFGITTNLDKDQYLESLENIRKKW